MATFYPNGDRLLVKVDETEEKTTTGIYLPDAVQEKPQKGEVVAVGQGFWEDGAYVPVPFDIGDTVLFTKYGGHEIKVGDEEFLLLRQDDVFGIFSD